MDHAQYTRQRIAIILVLSILVGFGLSTAFVIVPIAVRTYIGANRTTPITIFPDFYRLRRDRAGDDATRVIFYRRFASESWHVERELPPYISLNVRVGPSKTPTYPEIDTPRWVGVPPPLPGKGVRAVAFGWPFRCMFFRADTLTTQSPPATGTAGPNYSSSSIFHGRATVKLGPILAFSPAPPA